MEVDNEEWTTCPYDKAHRIRKSRIQYHIVKCMKNKSKLTICPYNATHRFPEQELKAHCNNCPQKPVKDLKTKLSMLAYENDKPKPILQQVYLPETDPNHECWDD